MATRSLQPRDWIVTPGDVLAEALEEQGLSQAELARRMGRPTKTINEIVRAKAAVTADTALQLELVLGVPSRLWLGLEAEYRRWLAESKALESFNGQRAWLRSFPVKDMVRHGLIKGEDTDGALVAQILGYFKVGGVDAWTRKWGQPSVNYRQSEAYEGNDSARAAWLRWGELLAHDIPTETYDRSKLVAAASELKAATRIEPVALAVQDAQEVLAEAGVAFIVTPEFEGVRLSGAARWLDSATALVQLSDRYKMDDQFWFSLLHEVGHILDGPGAEHLDPATPDAEHDADPAELRANAFARDALIDPDHLRQFVRTGRFGALDVADFAASEGVAPGIVVGRLQRDDVLSHGRHNHLKRRVSFSDG